MQHRNLSLYMFSCLLAAGCERTAADTANPEGATASAPSERDTHDDEILGVLSVINREAIQQGEYMKRWAKTQRVKEYAAMMINDHDIIAARQDELRDVLDLRATGSRLASDFRQDGRQKLRTLAKIDRGAPLDRAYVDMQVDVHAAWLGALDNQLIPTAQTDGLRTELEQLRRIIESHYNSAVDLRSELAVPNT